MAMNSSGDRISAPRIFFWAGLVIVLGFLFPTLFNIIFAARDELSYSAGIQSTTCSGFARNDNRPATNCLTIYAIKLGNTGINPQPAIEVSLLDTPATWRFSSSVVDIVASAQRRGSPAIDYSTGDGEALVRIEDLPRNRLVELYLTTLGFPAYRKLQTMSVAVSASGNVIESSPYVTVLSRFVRNLTVLF